MSDQLYFNPPPGWPAQSPGWQPPAGWSPPPSWPAAPAGWVFWTAQPVGPSSDLTAPLTSPPRSARLWRIGGFVAAGLAAVLFIESPFATLPSLLLIAGLLALVVGAVVLARGRWGVLSSRRIGAVTAGIGVVALIVGGALAARSSSDASGRSMPAATVTPASAGRAV